MTGRKWIAILTLAACAGGLTGCGAGQITQTTTQVAAVGGASGTVGSIRIRDAQFAWSGTVAGDAVYPVGQDAPIQVTIVNDATATQPDGMRADRLVAVSSPVARSGRITGEARIPDGQTLTAGYEQPVASIDLPGTSVATIELVGLTEPLQAGRTYPVEFTFEKAGSVTLPVPIENPPYPREDR